VAELTGKHETNEISDEERLLLRLLTPVMKLTTGKQTVVVLSEVIECFGGAGYVGDTGLPQLLRDAQVLPIWEGTTNVLSLDTIRAIGIGPTSKVSLLEQNGVMAVLQSVIGRCVSAACDMRLARVGKAASTALIHAQQWLRDASSSVTIEAGA